MFSGHSGPVTAGCFTPDGKTVLSAGGEGDSSLRVWNPKTGECTSSIQGHPFHEDGLTCLSVHSDGAAVITGAQDGSLRVTNIHNSRVLASPQGRMTNAVPAVPAACLCNSVTPEMPCFLGNGGLFNGTFILQCLSITACQWAQGVCTFNDSCCTNALLTVLATGHTDSVESVGFSPHLPLSASAGMDGKLVIWDATGFSERGVCQHDQVVWVHAALMCHTMCITAVSAGHQT